MQKPVKDFNVKHTGPGQFEITPIEELGTIKMTNPNYIGYTEADLLFPYTIEDFLSSRKATGLDGPYYDLPEGATQLQDLIEYKDMNFSIGNIFKATYRLNDKATKKYNLEKIIFYAQRELDRESRD